MNASREQASNFACIVRFQNREISISRLLHWNLQFCVQKIDVCLLQAGRDFAAPTRGEGLPDDQS